ncbi:MAG TPA: phosphatase domain-containing protein [Polyangiaceae bacterium]|nr:phosphatase domain-containing protein [Polyangiaceae bacterium]
MKLMTGGIASLGETLYTGLAMPGALEETKDTRAARRQQRTWARVVRFLARIELLIDRVVWGLRQRFGRLGPLQIVSYRGFGTKERVVLRGRVLEASVLERSLPADSTFRSFRRMLRRFLSRELPEATLNARLGANSQVGVTDDEGYFALPIAVPNTAGSSEWLRAEVEVVSAKVRGLVPVHDTVEILIPGANAELGIISDIDDTVLQTHVGKRLKMIWVTLSGSAFTRMPFEGTSELYHALAHGASGEANNPVFYVSKSPWNLYDFLVDFLEHHGLPRGPLLLRDIGLHEAPPVDHKAAAVQELLELYPKLPFVLIGDSGERDPEIYLEAALRNPRRIVAIYIRDLAREHQKGDPGSRAHTLSERARAYGTELLWIEHASQALVHARERGLAAPSGGAKAPT